MRGSLQRWTLRYPPASEIRFTNPIPPTSRQDPHNVTVAIPHFEAPEWCASTVQSFLDQQGVHLTIVVVDNSPYAGLVLPDEVEVVVMNENLGYSAAINHVLARWLSEGPADDHYFVAACHDCELEPHALATLCAALDSDPTLGIVGPSRSSGGTADAVSGRVWVSGTCLMLSHDCGTELGGLDEALGTYDEDLDLCLRAWDAGWRVGAVPAGTVVTRGSIARDRTERISRNHILLAAKRRGVLAAFLEAGLQLRRSVISAVKASRRGQSETHFEEARQRFRGTKKGLWITISRADARR